MRGACYPCNCLLIGGCNWPMQPPRHQAVATNGGPATTPDRCSVQLSGCTAVNGQPTGDHGTALMRWHPPLTSRAHPGRVPNRLARRRAGSPDAMQALPTPCTLSRRRSLSSRRRGRSPDAIRARPDAVHPLPTSSGLVPTPCRLARRRAGYTGHDSRPYLAHDTLLPTTQERRSDSTLAKNVLDVPLVGGWKPTPQTLHA